MGNFFTDFVSTNPQFTSSKRVSDLAMLEPETRRRVEALLADAAAAGVKLMVFETYRSKERQRQLFEQGASKLQKVGVHHYGLAADITRDVNGEPSWKGDFSIIGKLARKHGLVWGGDWGRPGVPTKFVDAVHVQRCTVARQNLLFGGSWYPDDVYNPWDELQPAVTRALRRITRSAKRAVKKVAKRGAKVATRGARKAKKIAGQAVRDVKARVSSNGARSTRGRTRATSARKKAAKAATTRARRTRATGTAGRRKRATGAGARKRVSA